MSESSSTPHTSPDVKGYVVAANFMGSLPLAEEDKPEFYPAIAVPETIASPDWFEDSMAHAKAFVAEEMGFPVSDLPSLELTRDELTMDSNHGLYDVMRHKAYVTARGDIETPSRERALALVRTGVHEVAHGAQGRDLISVTGILHPTGLTEDEAGQLDFEWGEEGVVGMVNSGQNKTLVTKERIADDLDVFRIGIAGHFYDEGLVEEIAIRYIESLGPLPASEYPEMARYEAYTPDTVTDDSLPTTSLAAWGLNVLEEARFTLDPKGQTIFEILKATRHRETRFEAMKKLAQAVNSIAPGLHSIINRTQYDEEAFFKTFEIIAEARNNVLDQQQV